MKNQTMTLLLRLAACPQCQGESEICYSCRYKEEAASCVEELRKEALTLINALETPQNPIPAETLLQSITRIIQEAGVPANLRGYSYLRDAIQITVNDPGAVEAVVKELYPRVAKNHQTTSQRVERAIRHAIEVAWDRADLNTLQRIFGYTIGNRRTKPTNSEFIALIADKLRLEAINTETK